MKAIAIVVALLGAAVLVLAIKISQLKERSWFCATVSMTDNHRIAMGSCFRDRSDCVTLANQCVETTGAWCRSDGSCEFSMEMCAIANGSDCRFEAP